MDCPLRWAYVNITGSYLNGSLTSYNSAQEAIDGCKNLCCSLPDCTHASAFQGNDGKYYCMPKNFTADKKEKQASWEGWGASSVCTWDNQQTALKDCTWLKTVAGTVNERIGDIDVKQKAMPLLNPSTATLTTTTLVTLLKHPADFYTVNSTDGIAGFSF
jgi:hypothetical protein